MHRGAQELGGGGQALHATMIVTVLAKFLYLFAASMCLGLAFGLGTSFLMKTFRSNSVPQARACPRGSRGLLHKGLGSSHRQGMMRW